MEQTRIYQVRAIARIEPLITSQLMGNFLEGQNKWQLTIDEAIRIKKTPHHRAYVAIDESNIDLGYLGKFIKRQPNRIIDFDFYFDFENEGYYKNGAFTLFKIPLSIEMIPFKLIPRVYQELLKIFPDSGRNWLHQTYYWNYYKNVKQNLYEIQKTILRVNITTVGNNTWVNSKYGDNIFAVSGIPTPEYDANYVNGLYTDGTTSGTLNNNYSIDSSSDATDVWGRNNQTTLTVT